MACGDSSARQQPVGTDGMGGTTRAVWMTSLAIETFRKATGCRLVALQGFPMTGSTRSGSICRCIAWMIRIGVYPAIRVGRKRRHRIVRVAAIAADGISAAGQSQSMAGFALVITGTGNRFRVMCGKPAFRVGVGVGRGIRAAAGTGTHE